MSDQTPDRRYGSPTQLALFAFGGLVLYILSPGPIVWVLKTANLGAAAPYVEVFFYPLKTLYDNIPLAKAFYDSYFTLLGLR